jgi:uncharacterized membrane protein YphA (DoxX/SURF4 family)
MVTVAMLVVLRVTIGWHFLYEGVWKIVNADKFSAAGFLAAAKGPAAPLFYWMVPDLEGHKRLRLTDTGRKVEGSPDDPIYTSEAYANAWARVHQKFFAKYKPSEEQAKAAEETLALYSESLEQYVTDRREEIEGYFGSLQRLKQRKRSGTNRAAHEKKRIWDEQMKLRGEVNGWLADLDGMSEEYQLALWNLLDEDQKARGKIRAPLSDADALPFATPVAVTWSGLLDFGVTYGLSAIGLCLLIGFCTRLAALGGAGFLFMVVLVQMPWPTIYPPPPEVVGHALLVDKNFVEMIAMILLATTAVGRWGGLDYFVYRWLGRPILEKLGFVTKEEDEQEAE